MLGISRECQQAFVHKPMEDTAICPMHDITNFTNEYGHAHQHKIKILITGSLLYIAPFWHHLPMMQPCPTDKSPHH